MRTWIEQLVKEFSSYFGKKLDALTAAVSVASRPEVSVRLDLAETNELLRAAIDQAALPKEIIVELIIK